MKKYKTTIIITTLITLLPIVIGLFLWNKLPDTLATHWGSDGTANGWSSKTFSVFGMPLILTAIHVLCLFVGQPRARFLSGAGAAAAKAKHTGTHHALCTR